MPEPLEHTGDGIQGSDNGGDADSKTSEQTGDTGTDVKEAIKKLEERLSEKDKCIAKMQSEKDKALHEAAKAREETLQRLVDAQAASAKPAAPAFNWDEAKKRIVEDGDGTYYIELLQQVISETADKRELADLKRELKEAKETLVKQMQEYDPRLLAQKDRVKELEKEYPGVPKSVLIGFAEKLAAVEGPKQTARAPIPGGGGSDRVVGGGQDGEVNQSKLAILEARFGKKLTKAEIEHVKKAGYLK